MSINPEVRQQLEVQIDALVKLQLNSPITEKTESPGELTWSPPEGSGVSLGDSKPVTFIRDRLHATNVLKTDDIQVFTALEPLGESRQLDMSDNWPDIEKLLLKDHSPIVVKNGRSEYQLKVLRIIEDGGQRKLFSVDMLQADNDLALENPQSSTEITDKNSYSVYPAVVKTKDLRADFKGVGPKIENALAVKFFSLGNADLGAAERTYLKPLIAAAQTRLLPPLKF